jgi:hypothetical protein
LKTLADNAFTAALEIASGAAAGDHDDDFEKRRRFRSKSRSEGGDGSGFWLIVIRSELCLIYCNLAWFGHEASVGGASVERV